jgi:RNA polymerase sigma factor (sigma-70 family)
MARCINDESVRQIHTLFRVGAAGGLTDCELLEHFLGGDESEATFAVLVDRHGPMVRSLCRSLLGDLHEADDAFQATFLVLARRARSIRDKEAVASWLYRSAYRLCLRMRAEATRRRALARHLAEQARVAATTRSQPFAEPIPELFEEVARLPDRYQAPIVLCYLEGQTHEQAARLLRCPLRTVQTRLLRAKAKLRVRLERRGLAPALGLFAVGIATAESSAAVSPALPAALAESTAHAATLYAATQSADIGPTILHLANQALKAALWGRVRQGAGLAAGLLVGLTLAFFALFAADNKSNEPVKAITGRVIDTQGRPIAGAEVWMPVKFDEPADSTARATTDADGHYALPVPELWVKTPQHERRWSVWAHAKGHQIATANAGKPIFSGKAEPIDLTLGSATNTSFLVLGPDGRPLAGAVVEPYHFKTPVSYEFPPRTMLPLLRGATDSSGRARLPALPRDGLMTVQVTAEAFGIQQVRLNDAATEPAERAIRLRAVGRLEGRIVTSHPEWAAGVTLYVTTNSEADGIGGAGSIEGFAKAVSEANGSFVIPTIATGQLRVSGQVDQTLPVRPRFPEGLEVRRGQPTLAEIRLEKAVRLRGAMRIKEAGEPVAGASISVQYGSFQQGDTVVSDARGNYEDYVLSGDVRTQVIVMPDGLVDLGDFPVKTHQAPAGAETFDLPPIEVVKGESIKGRLVDQEDRPLANLRILGSAGNRRYAFAMTDSEGAFTTNSIPPGTKLEYKVSINDHEAPVDATIVREQPLLIRAPIGGRPASAASVQMSGQVVDEEGRPVEGAEVTVSIEADGHAGPCGSLSINTREQMLATDASGMFRLNEPVAKGTRYRAIVAPGKFAIAATDAVTPSEARSITFSPITVQRLRTIAGRLVDSDGRPVVGATVLNWGNPAPLSSAVTGSTGRFQLDGFPRGSALLFVSAPGYRFHGTTPSQGKSIIELVIRRDDQPAERAIATLGPAISHPEAIELAAKVLKPYSDKMLDSGSDQQARDRVLEVLAQIDPAEAWRKCQADDTIWARDLVRVAVVNHVALTSVDQAEAIALTIKSEYWRLQSLIDLADALPADRHDAKVRILSKVAADAHGIPNIGLQVHFLMNSARRLIDVNRPAEARALLDEALRLAKPLDAGDPRLSHTRQALGPLARLDLKAALALIPAQGDELTINDFRGMIAQEIAAANPAEAERLIGQMNWNSSATLVLKTCRRMAPVDLPRARLMAGRIRIQVLRGYALGTMAGAVAATDRPAARKLLADSFVEFSEAVEQGRGGVWGGQSAVTMAGALLPIAERVDPDHLAETIQRLLTLRWFPRSKSDLCLTRPDTSNAESMRSNAALAALVSRYDHELARSIAEPVVASLRLPLSDVDNRFLDRYAVLPALALADPKGTATLVELIPDLKEEGIGQSRDIARLIVAKTLSAPESEFWTIIKRAVMDLEMVERED